MVRGTAILALLISNAALASCDEAPPTNQRSTLPTTAAADDCLDLPVYPPSGVTDLKQEVHACVERNAAMYARGRDSPEALSKAVIAKCELKIIRYVEQEAKAAGEDPQYNVALEVWRRHTLPIIAEARARRCYS